MKQDSNNVSRMLYKLSGEVLKGEGSSPIDKDVILRVCADIADVYKRGVQLSIVIGGGNIFRGAKISNIGIDRITGDHMGMLGTTINALAITSILREQFGVQCSAMSAIQMDYVCDFYSRRNAINKLDNGEVVIFSSGIGNPLVSTDTCAAMRAIELNCDVVIKGTSVDGVYSDDPKLNKDAKFLSDISYDETIAKGLKFMDTNAMMMLRDHKIPTVVFSIKNSDSPLSNLLNGNAIHSVIA